MLVEKISCTNTAPWPASAAGNGNSLQRVSATGFGNDPTNWLAAAATPGGVPGLLDSDGDGMTNLQEYLAGTNPTNAMSPLVMAISLTPLNDARLQFNAVSNVSYSFQHRTSLSTGAWLLLQSVPAAPFNRTVIITNVPGGNTHFYRVTVP